MTFKVPSNLWFHNSPITTLCKKVSIWHAHDKFQRELSICSSNLGYDETNFLHHLQCYCTFSKQYTDILKIAGKITYSKDNPRHVCETNTWKHFILKNYLGNEDYSFGILPLWGWHKTAIDFPGSRFHLWFPFFCLHRLKTPEIPSYMPNVHMDNYLMII